MDGSLLFEREVGRILTPPGMPVSYPAAPSRAGPRVLQVTEYDPGVSVYRYHSAMNAVEGGRSAFARYGHTNAASDLRQYDGDEDRETVEALYAQADVIHVHMDYVMLASMPAWPDRARQLLVRHYHGSAATSQRPVVQTEKDDALDAVQIGARLYHRRFSSRMHWLPIPMPVRDYARLAAGMHRHALQAGEPDTRRTIRVAHSSTNWRIKGTVALQSAVLDLQQKGVPVELVLIQNQPHGVALAMKARCDITFDSFWLGMQGSGLEGAAMGQAVIAGDPDVKAEYEASEVGYCPYTYARDYEELKPVLERLVMDPVYRAAEAARAHTYVAEWHDYPVVGARYWSIVEAERLARVTGDGGLATATGRAWHRDAMLVETRGVLRRSVVV